MRWTLGCHPLLVLVHGLPKIVFSALSRLELARESDSRGAYWMRADINKGSFESGQLNELACNLQATTPSYNFDVQNRLS